MSDKLALSDTHLRRVDLEARKSCYSNPASSRVH